MCAGTRSVSHADVAFSSAAEAVSTVSRALASSACFPVSADGTASSRSSLLLAKAGTSRLRPCACSALAAFLAATSLLAVPLASSPPAPGSSHPERDLLPKILRSCQTFTSFSHCRMVFSSEEFRRVCFMAQPRMGHSASTHSRPFLREFWITSLARYRNTSLRLPAAPWSSRSKTFTKSFAFLRWNTHQWLRVSMDWDEALRPVSLTLKASAMSPMALSGWIDRTRPVIVRCEVGISQVLAI